MARIKQVNLNANLNRTNLTKLVGMPITMIWHSVEGSLFFVPRIGHLVELNNANILAKKLKAKFPKCSVTIVPDFGVMENHYNVTVEVTP